MISIRKRYAIIAALAALLLAFFLWKQSEQFFLEKAYIAVMANSPEALSSWIGYTKINEYITLKDKTQTTLLIQAVIQKPDDVKAHRLLDILFAQKGLDPNKAERLWTGQGYIEGRKPINWAVERGNLAAVKLLAQAGAHLDVVDPLSKKTPLAFVHDEKNQELRDEWHLDAIEQILSPHS